MISLLSLTCWSCLDKIDLEVPAGLGSSIALQGRLVLGDPSIVTLNSSQIFDFTAESRQPITVKDPTLIDESGNEFVLEALGLGDYIGVIPQGSDFEVAVGKSYKMRVTTFDGRTYESILDPLLEAPQPESLNASFIEADIINNQNDFETETQLQFSISTPIRTGNQSGSLLWELSRTFKITDLPESFVDQPTICYVTENVSLDNISTVDPQDISTDRIENFPLYAQPVDYRFAEGYYFTAIQYSLSEQAYEYWTNINEIIQREGNMFEAPAGKIQSNFVNIDDPTDDVFGFFYASDTAALHFSVDSTIVGNFNNFCPPDVPPPPGGGCPVLICCDCTQVQGSATEPPSFWK